MIKNKLIFVTGIERSGASLISHLLSLSGVSTGIVSSRQENIQASKLLEKWYEEMGVDKRGQFPLPVLEDMTFPKTLKRDLEDIFNKSKENCFLLKSSKIIQTYPFWKSEFPEAIWIWVKRNPNDIIRSCFSTNYMDAFSTLENQRAFGVTSERGGWQYWIHYHESLKHQAEKEGITFLEITPEKMAYGDYSEIEKVWSILGLPFSQKIKETVDPLLSKTRIHKNINYGSKNNI